MIGTKNKEREKKLLENRVAATQDYKRTFSSEQGKRVLYDLIASNFVMSSTYSKEPQEMAFREGQRQTVLRILTIVETDETRMRELIREANEHVSNLR